MPDKIVLLGEVEVEVGETIRVLDSGWMLATTAIHEAYRCPGSGDSVGAG